VIIGSGLSGLRMGVRDPEIDCEGCLLGLWWIDGGRNTKLLVKSLLGTGGTWVSLGVNNWERLLDR
jgi:hypothetical protein